MSQIQIEKLPNRRPLSILIRHAERYSVAHVKDPMEVLLTEKGKTDSFNLGQEVVGLGPLGVYYSPAGRCRETAQGIASGISDKNGICELVNPLPQLDIRGHIIKGNWDDVVKIINKYSSHFLRMWFDGRLDAKRFMPLDQASFYVLNILVKQLKENHLPIINITHDWNIMIIREYFFGLKHEKVGLLDYLDGIAAYLEENLIHLHYHEHEVTVPISL